MMDSLQAEEEPSEISPREIEALLGKLTYRQQEVVRSISIQGASIRETADRLNMTEVAVRVSLHRALKALGELFRSSTGDD
jgi:RNA polymerase sigma-70 factor (ECF subfamily)